MRRTLTRIAVGGIAGALVVLVGGTLVARAMLGADDTEARARIHSEVLTAFESMTRDLRDVTEPVRNSADVRLAASGDQAAAEAAGRLFEAAGAAIDAHPTQDLALTLYGVNGVPLAWAGRPTEPRDRLQQRDSWFLARGELGLRLLYITAINDARGRAGTVVAERPLTMLAGERAAPGRRPCGASDAFCFPTRLGPVGVQLPEQQPPGGSTAERFEVRSPSGQLLFTATIRPEDLASTRARWWRATISIALMVGAFAVLLLIGPLLDWRNRARQVRPYAVATLTVAALVVTARLMMTAASPADWTDLRLFSAATYASWLVPRLLTSPFDFLLTWLTVASLAGLAFFSVESWRLHAARARRAVRPGMSTVGYLAMQAAAGVVIALVLLAHELVLENTISLTTLDLVHFSLQPLDSSRTALQVGLFVLHATVAALAVLVLRAALIGWRLPRHDWRLLALTIACWVTPLAIACVWRAGERRLPPLAMTVVVVTAAMMASGFKARYRHGSQAFRLMLLALVLIVPAVASYPTLFALAGRAKAEIVETTYADEAQSQLRNMLRQLDRSLGNIDAYPNLAERVTLAAADTSGPGGPRRSGEGPIATDLAFEVWKTTALALDPITSSVELYGPDKRLVSRFAFNLPEDLTEVPRSQENLCDWGDVYSYVSLFFAEERRVLHAGRDICSPTGERRGSIVVHAMLDYENLPFISSRTPYRDLLRPADSDRSDYLSGHGSDLTPDSRRGRDVEFAFYGWSGRQLYPGSEPAWEMDDVVMNRLTSAAPESGSDGTSAAQPTPFWHQMRRGDERFNVYFRSDRSGIYALGFPVVTPLAHLVNLAELTVLAAATYFILLLANGAFGWMGRRPASAPALLRELRASFYRKLFLAFVAAVILPVGALAFVTRNYVANEMRASIEQEAVRTAATARRVVEDLIALFHVDLDDNLMMFVSRLIDQDANVFEHSRLLATSERDLFASDLLPTRVPADVYRALQLRNERATVTRERVGGLEEYLVAATSLAGPRDGMVITVPLTSRQRDIESQITTLTRRLLLGALIFVLGGAFLGYWMAERISDPVNRLTRATRRISRGDLNARILARSSDELRRLVEDFNSMAGELQRQRKELERTHRVEAWAEMARQVAHDIKNPLTPIQLTAEHLRRVHADRGEPLSPVLQDCVQTILTQVRLLRQIASEFSSFASSPTARPAVVSATALIHDIVEPYRVGLQDRIRFAIDVPGTLQPLYVDRGLVTRALSNLVENALHAMPGRGALTVTARDDRNAVVITVGDTGAGMDAEALARAFEPYFSTKATGTGLGLTIAKRNIELNGGTIAVRSEKERGTTVELRLPAATAGATA